MKKLFTLILTLTFSSLALMAQVEDSVDMNAGYAMDVFYSLDNGTVQTVANSEWTVALSTGAQTASVYINDGKGVDLYETTVSISNFNNTIDTNGLSSSWTKIYNDYNDWEHSAFEYGAITHPDYGWGSYNSVSHVLQGEKVFVLKTLEDEVYKVAILKKETGAWHFRYATLNNSFDTTIVYQASNLTDRNFAYLNMDNHIVSNREPSNSEWDMLFTKYYDTDESYAVTGVLLNKGNEVVEIDGEATSSATYVGETFNENTKIIGSDWKTFDLPSSTYIVDTDRTYFVKQLDGEIYKIHFNRFDGNATGKIGFTKQKMSTTSVKDINAIKTLSIYPNPAISKANLIIDANENADISYTVFNLVGKKLDFKKTTITTGLNVLNIDVADFNAGIYLVQIQNGNNTETLKLNVAK